MRDDSRSLAISLLLFIFSFILRLSFISKGPYSIDGLSIMLHAQKLLDTHSFEYHFGFGYPLTIILAAVFVGLGRLFSVGPEIAVNFMSVVFGSLCIPLFYLFARSLMGNVFAALCAILLSLCPIFISVSVYGIGHTPALFFLLGGLLLLIKFFQEGRFNLLVLGAVSFGACGASRIQDLILFLPALTYFFFLNQKFLPDCNAMAFKVRMRFFLVFLFVCLFFSFLFHLPFLGEKTYFQQLNYFQKVSIINFADVNLIWKKFLYNLKCLTQTLSLLGMILCVGGLGLLAKERPFVFVFLLGWILTPLYLLCNLNTIVARHQILILPPLIMAECYLLTSFLRHGRLFRLSALFLYGLIIVWTFGYYLPPFVYRHRHSSLIEYSQSMEKLTETNARIIGGETDPFIEHYGHRKSLERMLRDKHVLEDTELSNYKKKLEGLLDEGTPLYITETGLYTYDFEEKFSNFMKMNFRLEYVGTSKYEDWHRDYLQRVFFIDTLYRIKKK